MQRPLKLIMLMALLGLGGCETWRYPLPACDGAARRPLNVGQWPHAKRADLGGPATPCGRRFDAIG